MSEPLRPMSLGEILDRMAQLYRTRFLLFLGIAALPTGVVVALGCGVGLAAAWWHTSGAGSVSIEAGYALIAIFAILVTLVALPILLAAAALALAALNHAAIRIHLGETTTIRDAYRSVWKRGWRYIGLLLLEALIVGVAPMAVWFVAALVAAGGMAWSRKLGVDGGAVEVLFALGAVVAVVGLIGYFFWMLLRISLAFPACVAEQISSWPAIKRSFALSRGTKGRIFVLYLLGSILSYLLMMALALPVVFGIALIPGMQGVQHQQTLAIVMVFIIYGASFAVQVLVRPVYGIALVLFYYDQRIRKEGYDIERMMEAAGLNAPVPSPVGVDDAAPGQAEEAQA